jgi:hypothetical protein
MKFKILVSALIIFFTFPTVYAQPQINGASCVIPTTDYDYLITGNADSVASITVCITGGIFANTQNTCKTITPHSMVRINWNDSATTAKIIITYSGTQKTKQILVTKPLSAGIIANQLKRQIIKYDAVAAFIPCSEAKHGSCSPNYSYQWQKSSNALSWTDITGANGQHLPPQGALKEPVFYRRKVTETVSGTVAYSTMATVFVEVP